MTVRYHNPSSHHDPAGDYSHAAIVEAGRLAFVAGQIALDADGSLVGKGDVAVQARQVFRNLMAIVDALGAAPSDIAELKTFLVGDSSLPEFREARSSAYAKYFPDGTYPPNTLVLVSGLASPEIEVEISAVVALGG